MGNHYKTTVKGLGTIKLEFTSGKTLMFTDVYHVLEVKRNFVSGSILNKCGFKIVIESDFVTFLKGSAFVGKLFVYNGIFKMNINKTIVSAYG